MSRQVAGTRSVRALNLLSLLVLSGAVAAGCSLMHASAPPLRPRRSVTHHFVALVATTTIFSSSPRPPCRRRHCHHYFFVIAATSSSLPPPLSSPLARCCPSCRRHRRRRVGKLCFPCSAAVPRLFSLPMSEKTPKGDHISSLKLLCLAVTHI